MSNKTIVHVIGYLDYIGHDIRWDILQSCLAARLRPEQRTLNKELKGAYKPPSYNSFFFFIIRSPLAGASSYFTLP